MTVTETCRMLLSKAREWHLPVLLGQQDVQRAFEHMSSLLVDDAMKARGAWPEERYAYMMLTSDLIMKARLNCTWSLPFHVCRGGVTGGIETPECWNSVVSLLVKPLVDSWREQQFGFVIREAEGHDKINALINLLIWVDNFHHLSTSWDQFTQMVIDMTNVMYEAGFVWKQKESFVMANEHVPEICTHPAARLTEEALIVEVSPETVLVYKRKRVLNVLGVALNETGDPVASTVARKSSAMQKMGARRKQLCATQVEFVPRLVRWSCTVRSSFLHASGGWSPTVGVQKICVAFEHKCLRMMWGRREELKNDEFMVPTMTRLARQAMDRCESVASTVELVAGRYLRWAGHVARLPRDSPLHAADQFRSCLWWKQVQASPRLLSRCRHHQRGRPPFLWATPLCRVLGPKWRSAAQNRTWWRSQEPSLVKRLLEVAYQPWRSPARLRWQPAFVERCFEPWACPDGAEFLQTLEVGGPELEIRIRTDSEKAAQAVLALCVVKCDTLKEAVRVAKHRLSWITAEGAKHGWSLPVVQSVPRGQNTTADALSKVARQAQRPFFLPLMSLEEAQEALCQACAVQLETDGAGPVQSDEGSVGMRGDAGAVGLVRILDKQGAMGPVIAMWVTPMRKATSMESEVMALTTAVMLTHAAMFSASRTAALSSLLSTEVLDQFQKPASRIQGEQRKPRHSCDYNRAAGCPNNTVSDTDRYALDIFTTICMNSVSINLPCGIEINTNSVSGHSIEVIRDEFHLSQRSQNLSGNHVVFSRDDDSVCFPWHSKSCEHVHLNRLVHFPSSHGEDKDPGSVL